jgi:hypothetical protein
MMRAMEHSVWELSKVLRFSFVSGFLLCTGVAYPFVFFSV